MPRRDPASILFLRDEKTGCRKMTFLSHMPRSLSGIPRTRTQVRLSLQSLFSPLGFTDPIKAASPRRSIPPSPELKRSAGRRSWGSGKRPHPWPRKLMAPDSLLNEPPRSTPSPRTTQPSTTVHHLVRFLHRRSTWLKTRSKTRHQE